MENAVNPDMYILEKFYVYQTRAVRSFSFCMPNSFVLQFRSIKMHTLACLVMRDLEPGNLFFSQQVVDQFWIMFCFAEVLFSWKGQE